MKEFIKREYKNLILVFAYIVIANLAYIIWFQDLWGLWYIDLITAIVITALGVLLGYFYIKSEEKKKLEVVDAKDYVEQKEESSNETEN